MSDWSSVAGTTKVLVVAHTVTSMTRLLDAVALLEGDLRLETVCTVVPASAFENGTRQFVDDAGLKRISWEEALERRFDLALAAGNSGELHRINAPLLIMPHGIGYNKYKNQESRIKNQESRIKNQESRIKNQVYGLAPDQLLHDGRLVPDAIVMSHEEQLARLRRLCPPAVPAAVVAGDVCFDRLAAGLPIRDRYRAKLGLRDSERLIVVTSTWGPGSLINRRPGLYARLLAELPADEYRVAAITHPNVWYGHGPWQLRAWLADSRRAGLVVIPPREGWRAALVAADCVIGDHGSVTLYGAALGRPALLGSFGYDQVDSESPMAEFARRAAVLEDHPRHQIEAAIGKGGSRELAGLAFAHQGRAGERLRAVMYRLMGMDPPTRHIRPLPVPPAVPEPRPWEHGDRPALIASVTREPGDVLRLERFPAELEDLREAPLTDPHLIVDETEPDERLRALADVVIYRGPATGGARCAARVTPDGCCVVRLRGARPVKLHAEPALDPSILASAAYAWLGAGREVPRSFTLRLGADAFTVRADHRP